MEHLRQMAADHLADGGGIFVASFKLGFYPLCKVVLFDIIGLFPGGHVHCGNMWEPTKNLP